MLTALEVGDIVKIGYSTISVLAYDENSCMFDLTGDPADRVLTGENRYRFKWPASAPPFNLKFEQGFYEPKDVLQDIKFEHRDSDPYWYITEERNQTLIEYKVVLDADFSTTGKYYLIPRDVLSLHEQKFPGESAKKIKGRVRYAGQKPFSCGLTWKPFIKEEIPHRFAGDLFKGKILRLYHISDYKYAKKNYRWQGNRTLFLKNMMAVLTAENGELVYIDCKHLITTSF